jgi:ABC-2 type transport system permease protein
VIFGALISVIGREYKRVIRRPARLASTFARPLIWLIIIGSGFSAVIQGGQFSYHKYLLPGIIGMVILFSSLLSALGSVHDREFGSMRMLLIAPLPRAVIVVGKTISATLLGVTFAVVLSPLAWLFQIHVGLLPYIGFLGAALLTGLAISSFGMLVASRMRKLENFAVVMNFVIFPMFFLSGALYLTNKLPGYLQPLVRVNPLTYGVDLMRHLMLGNEPLSWSRVEFGAGWDIGYLVAFTVFALTLASLLFGGEEHLSAIFLSRVPRRVPFLNRIPVSLPQLPSRPHRRRTASPAPPATELAPLAPPGTVNVAILGALGSVIEREFKRALRQRGRLISTFARPLIWLIAVGSGFSALIPGGQYQKFLMPGIIGMIVLFSTMLSALGSVHDRQFGPMRMLLVAPVPRGVIVLGKAISSALIGVAFALVMSPLAWLFHIDMSVVSYLGFVGAVILSALALSALGMLAASVIRALEDFAVAMNFVIFPMFFFSGALYPANTLPGYMQPIVRINPLTYGVDLMRQTMLAGESRVLSPVMFAPGLDVAYLLAFSIVTLGLAALLFGRDGHLAPMFLASTPKPGTPAGGPRPPRRPQRRRLPGSRKGESLGSGRGEPAVLALGVVPEASGARALATRPEPRG